MRLLRGALPYLGVLLVVLGGIALSLALFASAGSVVELLLLPVGIAFIVIGVLTIVFGLLVPAFLRASPPPQQQIDLAVEQGRVAFARVLGVRPTGVRVGNTWEFALDLVVASTDRPAYRSLQFVRGTRNPTAFVPGQLITVVRIAQDGPRVVLLKDAAETDQSSRVPDTADGWR